MEVLMICLGVRVYTEGAWRECGSRWYEACDIIWHNFVAKKERLEIRLPRRTSLPRVWFPLEAMAVTERSHN